MEFISNHNKGLIWGLLQESDAFNGIENDKFTNIQAMFEDTVINVDRTNSKLTLLEKNKLTMNTMIKKINEHASAAEIKSLARKSGMVTMLEDGLTKAKQGITTIEEVLRVTRE